ncbi:MAG: hypothetical protein AAGI30_11995 [Planctomycetota bacterium]
MSTDTTTPGTPVLPEVKMNAVKPTAPVIGRVVSNELCTAGRKSAGFVRHISIDVSGTPLAGNCRVGQAFGVVPPGEDRNSKPHKPRLYSLASPTAGEDGEGNVISTTCKRAVDEHWETGKLFLGVASNYICDLAPGDEVRVCGPNGKRFLLPDDPDQHEYIFFATGTGIAPFRGMVQDLIAAGVTGRITLIMGTPYATDLLYHSMFLDMEQKHENFTYLTAVSREKQDDGHSKLYVQDRLDTHAEQLLPQLRSEKNLIYICGIAGMELGIFKQLAKILRGSELEQYLVCEPEALADIDNWDRKMLHKQVKPTKRMLLEVYA